MESSDRLELACYLELRFAAKGFLFWIRHGVYLDVFRPNGRRTPLVERMNHLESLLVSNLLGFLLTTTVTIFGAAYELRSGTKTPFVTPTQIFVGASVFYVFLSGYYYYMLAQFYACVYYSYSSC